MPEAQITVGAGLFRPQGRRLAVAGVDGLATTLAQIPPAVEAWWAPHVWKGDTRDSEAWESASWIALDVDREKHQVLPGDQAVRIEAAARAGEFSGSVFHRTPAGARVVFALVEPCTDPDLFDRAARGAAAMLAADLHELGLDHELAIDPKPHADLARLYFTPNSIAKGVERHADVVVMRRAAYRIADLAAAFDDQDLEPPTPLPRASNAPRSDPARRAAAYIRSMGPSVEGNHGDDHAFRVAAVLTNDFALPESIAWDLLCDWNQACQPPWSERDLKRFLRSASRNGSHAPGLKLAEDRPRPSPAPRSTGNDPAPAPAAPEKKSATELLRITNRSANISRLRERQRLRFIPLGDLPEQHGWGTLMDKTTGGGLAPGSFVSFGAAGSGAGKTAFLMQLLDGVAMRSAIAARDPEATTPLTPVAIFSEMDAEDLECRTLGRLLEVPGTIFAAGVSAKMFKPSSWVDEQYDRAEAIMQPGGIYAELAAWQRISRPAVRGPGFIECIEDAVAEWVAELEDAHPGREIVPIIAVDPVNRFLPLDGRSEVETLGEAADMLDRMADRRRWIVCVTVDTNKSAAKDASDAKGPQSAAAAYRGSMQLIHAADLAVVLMPSDADENGVTRFTLSIDKNRHGRKNVEVLFDWHTDTGLRFVAESEDEWRRRIREERSPAIAISDAMRHRVVHQIAALVGGGVMVTRGSMRPRAKELGTSKEKLELVIDAAILAGELVEQPKRGQGGGLMLVPTGKSLEGASEDLTQNMSEVARATSATSPEEVAGPLPATSGNFGNIVASAEDDSQNKLPMKLPGSCPATSPIQRLSDSAVSLFKSKTFQQRQEVARDPFPYGEEPAGPSAAGGSPRQPGDDAPPESGTTETED